MLLWGLDQSDVKSSDLSLGRCVRLVPELFTREEPFKDLHPMQIMRAIDRGERPFLPPACPPVYRHLVYDCWQTNPRLRPSFQHIIDRLVPLQQLQQPYTTP